MEPLRLHRTVESTLLAAVTLVACAASGQALAQSGNTGSGTERLDNAIARLARERGVEILFSPRLLAGRRVLRRNQRGPFNDALAALLRDTGITFRQTPDGAYYLIGYPAAARPRRDTAKRVPAAGVRNASTVDDGDRTIIVTGRKRAELLDEAPISVAAFTAREIEARGARKLEDLIPFSPGVYFTQQGYLRPGRVDANVRFRGMSSNVGNPQEQLATVFVDGVPMSDGIQSLSFEDVERVEVISGPQSAIFGRSTFSGAINIITRQPSEQARLHGEVVTDASGDVDLSTSVEGPISPGVLAAKLSARMLRVRGDYRNPVVPGQRLGRQGTETLAGALRLTLNDFTASARLRYSHDDDGPPAGWALGVREANCGPFGGGDRRTICGDLPDIRRARFGQNTGDPAAVAALLTGNGSRSFVLDPPPEYGMNRTTWNASLRMSLTIPSLNAVVEANGGYNRRHRTILADSDQGPDTVTTAFYPMKSADKSLELRLRSRAPAPFRWSIGTSYFDQQYRETVEGIYSALVLPTSYTPVCTSVPAQCDQSTRKAGAGNLYLGTFPYFIGHVTTRAVFGSADLFIAPSVQLGLELRKEWDRVRDTTLPGRPLARTFSNVLYRGVVAVEPFEGSTLYLSASNGNLPGGFNATVLGASPESRSKLQALGVTDTLPQQTLQNLEAGFKVRTGTASVRVSAYRMRWRNQRIRRTFFDAAKARTISYLDAEGKADLSGVEMQASWSPREWLALDFTGNVAAARYRRQSSGVALRVLGNGDVAGNSIPGSPRYSGTLSAMVRGSLDSRRSWYATADAVYRGRIFVDELNLTTLPPAPTLNARAGIRNGKFGLELFVSNLLQSRALRFAAPQSDISAYVPAFDFTNPGFITEAPPTRKIGLKLSVSY